MKREIYYNDEKMGEYEVVIKGDKMYIINENDDDRYIEVLTTSGAMVYVNQRTEFVIGTESKVPKEHMQEITNTDLTEEQVMTRVQVFIANKNKKTTQTDQIVNEIWGE